MLPAPEKMHLTVPAEEIDSVKRYEVTKSLQRIWRAGMENLLILLKQYPIPTAKMHHHVGHFRTAALAQTVLKIASPGIYAAAK